MTLWAKNSHLLGLLGELVGYLGTDTVLRVLQRVVLLPYTAPLLYPKHSTPERSATQKFTGPCVSEATASNEYTQVE